MSSNLAVRAILLTIKTFVVLAGMLLLSLSSANSQGLKGAPEFVRNGQPSPMMEGTNDEQRWQKFFAVQENLIGMSYKDVVNKLGSGLTDKNNSYLSYQLTDEKPGAPSKPIYLELQIEFSQAKVQKFTVRGVYRVANSPD